MTDPTSMTGPVEWHDARGDDRPGHFYLEMDSRALDGRLSLDATRALCAEIGLPFDEDGAEDALAVAWQHGLTQEQFDAAMAMHARRVKFLFTPPAYGWWQRIAIAFHFLVNPRRWKV